MIVVHFNNRNFEITGWDTPIGRIYANITCGHKIEESLESTYEALTENENSFIKVATLVSPDLDKAFHDTNHIMENWVDALGDKGEAHTASNKTKSTSVGDIMIVDGVVSLVAGIGFVQVNGVLADLIIEMFGSN